MNDMIAVCTATHVGWKDGNTSYRAGEIFDLIESMRRCDNRERLGLSVIDCSVDVPGLGKRIRDAWPGELWYTFDLEALNHPAFFGRIAISYAFNRAAAQAAVEKIFLTGMDTYLPKNFVELYDQNVGEGKVWAPICMFSKEKHRTDTNGFWRSNAKGIIGILKRNFFACGGQDERIGSPKWFYGKELPDSLKHLKNGHDTVFYRRLEKAGYKIIRGNCPGLLSLDHPEIDPKIPDSDYNK